MHKTSVFALPLATIVAGCFNPPPLTLTDTDASTGGSSGGGSTIGVETTSGMTTVDPDTTASSGETTTDPTTDPTTGTTGPELAPEIEVSIEAMPLVSGEPYPIAGELPVGGMGPVLTVTVENTGTAPLQIAGISPSGAGVGHFVVDDSGLDAAIEPGEFSEFTVAFAPQNGGLKQIILAIDNDDPDESPFDLVLRAHTVANQYRLLSPVPSPSARFNAAMEALGDGRLLLFGGRDAMGTWLADTWIYDIEANTWTMIVPPVSPPIRAAHELARVGPDTVVMFGGSAGMGGNPLGDTWIFDVATEQWSPVMTPSPSARFQHSMVAIGNATAILFGGQTAATDDFNDTWAFDGVSQTWSNLGPVGAPINRSSFAAAYDGDDTLTVYGGFNGTVPINDVWNYSIAANVWTLASPINSPGDRAVLLGEYLEGRMVVFSGKLGGCCIDPVGGTFAYDPGADAWTEITPSMEPAPRFNYAMASVPGSNKAILFGGALQNIGIATAQADTWEYVGPLPARGLKSLSR